MIHVPPRLAPFYRRNGEPRPLTRTDYATIAGIPEDEAGADLTRMVRAGELVSSNPGGKTAAIYELAPVGSRAACVVRKEALA